jgi:hypothetical protein
LAVCDNMNKHCQLGRFGGILDKIEEEHLSTAPPIELMTANLAFGGILDPICGLGFGLLIHRFAPAPNNRCHLNIPVLRSRRPFFDFAGDGFKNSMPI